MSCVYLPDRGLTYKDSGVDIAAGNRLVDMIKPLAKATARAGNHITLSHFLSRGLSLVRSRLKCLILGLCLVKPWLGTC